MGDRYKDFMVCKGECTTTWQRMWIDGWMTALILLILKLNPGQLHEMHDGRRNVGA